MKTLKQKIADALVTSRQKWVKYPKWVVNSSDPCGFCDEFGMVGVEEPCALCEKLFWGGEWCVRGIRCDSTDPEWLEACDIMQAKFDKIGAMRIGVLASTRALMIGTCVGCGIKHGHYQITSSMRSFVVCKSCLAKVGLDMSEYGKLCDEKVGEKYSGGGSTLPNWTVRNIDIPDEPCKHREDCPFYETS